jgi:hypothetical protein
VGICMTLERCPDCGGLSGFHWFSFGVQAGDKDCSRCSGTGREPLWNADGWAENLGLEPCKTCGKRVLIGEYVTEDSFYCMKIESEP